MNNNNHNHNVDQKAFGLFDQFNRRYARYTFCTPICAHRQLDSFCSSIARERQMQTPKCRSHFASIPTFVVVFGEYENNVANQKWHFEPLVVVFIEWLQPLALISKFSGPAYSLQL